MSTIPLRIDTNLVNVARESAEVMDRTPTAQIEFWAKLGRVMEGVLTHDALVIVKGASRVKRLDELLAMVSTPEGKERALAVIKRHKGPTYSADPTEPGVIVETQPDGSKCRGKFSNRRFKPLVAAHAE
jgi:hypothetical protein